MLTYRDPNLTESYDVMTQIGGLFADKDMDQDTLNGYILSGYSGYALSQGVLTTASQNLNYSLRRFPDDIAMVNKFYDLAVAQTSTQKSIPQSVLEHYKALEHTASECIGCRGCESRCPFGVEVADRMAKTAELFGC